MDCVYVDARYFSEGACAVTIPKLTSDFAALISKLQADGITCFVPDGGYQMVTGEGRVLGEVIYGAADELGLDLSDVLSLSRLLDRCKSYAADVDQAYEIEAEGAPRTSSGYASAYSAIGQDMIGVVVGLPYVNGRYRIHYRPDGASKELYLLTDEPSALIFYRDHLASNQCSTGAFERLREIAFPLIVFGDRVDPEDLRVNLAERAQRVVDHLSFLNDQYISIGEENAWDLPRIQRHAGAAGVDLSDESSNTKQDSKKIAQRSVTVTIDGSDRIARCTLHTKIEATRGRIHFSVEMVRGARAVVVGLMCEHLPT